MVTSVWDLNQLVLLNVPYVRSQCSLRQRKAGVSIFCKMGVQVTRDNPYDKYTKLLIYKMRTASQFHPHHKKSQSFAHNSRDISGHGTAYSSFLDPKKQSKMKGSIEVINQ